MKMIDWVFRWKLRFSSDPEKEVQEVVYSRKNNQMDHPLLYFNENLVKSSSTHKYLKMVLGTKSSFNFHLKNVQSKIKKTIGLQNTLHRASLITIFI